MRRLGDMALDLGLRHAGVMLERQRRDRLTVLGAAADAGEGDHRTHVGTAAHKFCGFGSDV